MDKPKPKRKQPAKTEDVVNAINSRLTEFADAYIFIGIGVNGETMLIEKGGTKVQSLALRTLSVDYVNGDLNEQGT